MTAIPLHDRIQAVLRHPSFRKEAAAFAEQVGREVERLSSSAERTGYLAKILTDNRLARKWGIPASLTVGAGHVLEQSEMYRRGFDRRVLVQDVAEGRYITLKIDMALPPKDIDRMVQAAVTHYKSLLGLRQEGRHKTCVCNPWEVWDQYHNKKKKEKKSLLRIAKSLHGSDKNPAYDKEMKAVYEQVRRAYAQAQKMIHAVGQSVIG